MVTLCFGHRDRGRPPPPGAEGSLPTLSASGMGQQRR